MLKDLESLLIVGGGAIGLTIAWRAAKAGRSVRVVEAGRLGRESSWAGAGLLPAAAPRGVPVSDALESLRSLSHALHASWAEELREVTGIDTGYRASGGLHLARTRGERASLMAQQVWWREHGIGYEAWRRGDGAKDVAWPSGMSSEIEEAWYVSGDCVLRNPHHVAALVEACRREGVELVEQAKMIGVQREGSRVVAVETTQEVYGCGQVVVASGAWSGALVAALGVSIEVYPVRGQMVLLKQAEATFAMPIHEGHRYLVPREDGRVLIGSCEEEVGFDKRTTEEMLDDLKAWAFEVMPALAGVEVERTWAGLRPATVDGFPYIGKVPGWENAFVATGHFRHGLHWSTGTAALVLDLLEGVRPAIAMGAFAVQRG